MPGRDERSRARKELAGWAHRFGTLPISLRANSRNFENASERSEVPNRLDGQLGVAGAVVADVRHVTGLVASVGEVVEVDIQ
jgi:hypothetical protein